MSRNHLGTVRVAIPAKSAFIFPLLLIRSFSGNNQIDKTNLQCLIVGYNAMKICGETGESGWNVLRVRFIRLMTCTRRNAPAPGSPELVLLAFYIDQYGWLIARTEQYAPQVCWVGFQVILDYVR